MHAFIGNNAQRYMRVFHRLDQGGGAVGWNWAAFFFNIFWLAYRKLFVPAGIAAAAILVSMLIASFGRTNLTVIMLFGMVAPIAIAAAVGILGDSLLRKRAHAVIGDACHRYPDPQARLAAIAAGGGMSIVALVVSLAVWIGIQVILYASGISYLEVFNKDRYRGSGYYQNGRFQRF